MKYFKKQDELRLLSVLSV